MKDCLKCDNKIPEGRVVSLCDGCLALRVYGNALDRIIELVDKGRAHPNRVRNIAVRALRSVPREVTSETSSE